ncbi:hypothetical protein [Mucilaginibacter sp.]
MRFSKSFFLVLITLFLAIYYLVCGIYLNHLGYTNTEALFYIEKARIVFEGSGNRIKVMGLTSPIFPFYSIFIFFITCSKTLAPVIASAIGTAVLFNIMAGNLVKRFNDDFYLLILLIIFIFHPGILFVACSGKGVYLVLIFFFLFFLNILKFYRSNTTFHISIASICLVILVFCDYKFIWLTLFFIPLVLSIAIQSLNLSEKESIFRLFLSFNSPSLRRKLISKTFALYIIIFILPIASVIGYKLLNLTHANDLNYFLESPYATWNVLSEKMNFDQMANTRGTSIIPEEISLLISAKALLFCPMIILAIYLFRRSTYQILTLLTPFGLIEFLHIKYDKTYLAYEYYLIFLILALLCITFRAQAIRRQKTVKLVLILLVPLQIFTGYLFLQKSFLPEERDFIKTLVTRKSGDTNNQSAARDVAYYLNGVSQSSKILVDDAIAYPIIAYVDNVKQLTMPYQDEFSGAIEAPQKYDDYILIATAKNPVTGYTQLNDKYIATIKLENSALNLRIVYDSEDWILYHIER